MPIQNVSQRLQDVALQRKWFMTIFTKARLMHRWQKQKRTGGRNNNGHITTRHVGGGHKQHYRIVDFKRNKDGVPAVVERIEYDPNRTAHIALLKYADGERRYIIAPKGLRAGDKVQSGNDVYPSR